MQSTFTMWRAHNVCTRVNTSVAPNITEYLFAKTSRQTCTHKTPYHWTPSLAQGKRNAPWVSKCTCTLQSNNYYSAEIHSVIQKSHYYFLSYIWKNCISLATLKSWMTANSSIKFIHVFFTSERCISFEQTRSGNISRTLAAI